MKNTKKTEAETPKKPPEKPKETSISVDRETYEQYIKWLNNSQQEPSEAQIKAVTPKFTNPDITPNIKEKINTELKKEKENTDEIQPEKVICGNCGHQIIGHPEYCPYCGIKLDWNHIKHIDDKEGENND